MNTDKYKIPVICVNTLTQKTDLFYFKLIKCNKKYEIKYNPSFLILLVLTIKLKTMVLMIQKMEYIYWEKKLAIFLCYFIHNLITSCHNRASMINLKFKCIPNYSK